jgi:hypothetical protein
MRPEIVGDLKPLQIKVQEDIRPLWVEKIEKDQKAAPPGGPHYGVPGP